MPKIGAASASAAAEEKLAPCALCCLLLVMKGSKRVWNLTKEAKYDLVAGDYLFTPAGDVHRVKYFEDTEFFIKWEGKWDIFFDEEMEAAKVAIDKEAEDGYQLIK
ncbi:unnamed protein product [Linum tenue]|uniref:Cupin 2 conserved barrel domain-containing protein n=1 Tax=Linum tenue TaxID=586396 RepID=A0AAV0HGP3_9ROSI|nr:unnamed protein product [Linum tenue]CAI0384490.1 unnamed protein product [Linum tenue]